MSAWVVQPFGYSIALFHMITGSWRNIFAIPGKDLKIFLHLRSSSYFHFIETWKWIKSKAAPESMALKSWTGSLLARLRLTGCYKLGLGMRIRQPKCCKQPGCQPESCNFRLFNSPLPHDYWELKEYLRNSWKGPEDIPSSQIQFILSFYRNLKMD